ncbi:hypothetical protein LINGRAHAP2_LOCUS11431 [Linum grandiflorum]
MGVNMMSMKLHHQLIKQMDILEMLRLMSLRRWLVCLQSLITMNGVKQASRILSSSANQTDGYIGNVKVDESEEMACVSSESDHYEWSQASITNTASGIGSSSGRVVPPNQSLTSPSSFLSRFSFIPGNVTFTLSRATSLGSSRAYLVASSTLRMPNDEEGICAHLGYTNDESRHRSKSDDGRGDRGQRLGGEARAVETELGVPLAFPPAPSSEDFSSGMPNSLFGIQDHEVETSRSKEARYHDLLERVIYASPTMECIRVLPCHHEFHRACIDKWLTEIHSCFCVGFDSYGMSALPRRYMQQTRFTSGTELKQRALFSSLFFSRNDSNQPPPITLLVPSTTPSLPVTKPISDQITAVLDRHDCAFPWPRFFPQSLQELKKLSEGYVASFYEGVVLGELHFTRRPKYRRFRHRMRRRQTRRERAAAQLRVPRLDTKIDRVWIGYKLGFSAVAPDLCAQWVCTYFFCFCLSEQSKVGSLDTLNAWLDFFSSNTIL